ncbi:beta-ketoacyl synthase N-terminal-like domain-containing protein [Psychroflexus montanilacus]|uniref:beta-ketoacyl synthase N-terminal-like domain-containing protein n=1 Tax=Psychroflexus montanilacus TaxID=2873598 RepID=UPI001CCF86C8|nr:beta-ketoacyl synthase N-terminal-like domain-containing protein [Psychroflexus montanilacus]MBZ9652809.1 beta-ketoacyl synthase [Psychroflexus montanilacus]
MKHPIYINGFGSISALGHDQKTILKNYRINSTHFSQLKWNSTSVLGASLATPSSEAIEKLSQENSRYKDLDRSVLMAMLTARQAMSKLKFQPESTGINIGSSRGATTLFENHHKDFLEGKKLSPLTSPTTTLGNISSWVAQDLGVDGPNISHSITCSTALHAMLNAKAWLEAEMCDLFLVGGSEAPLTEFTVAQMQALKLYSKLDSDFPCESLKLDKLQNSLVLGEAAATAVMSKSPENALAQITGFGFATEQITHNISISSDAQCFQKSMTMALKEAGKTEVDAIVLHAPGTKKGDQAEVNAIQSTFENLPLLTTNKWKLGHTFGASGMLSIEMALLMLTTGEFFENPFYKQQIPDKAIESVMVNAVGFGGNAVSILLEKPKL